MRHAQRQPPDKLRYICSLARVCAALGRNTDAVQQQRRALALHAFPADDAIQLEARTSLATTLVYMRTPAALREARIHLAHVLAWLDRNQPGANAQSRSANCASTNALRTTCAARPTTSNAQ